MDNATMIPPAELAKRVLARIVDDPDCHRQTTWVRAPGGRCSEWTVAGAVWALDLIRAGRCGTTACAAGWAVIEALDMGAALNPADSIRTAAADLLGLDPATEAQYLFAGSADRGMVVDALAAIADGRRPCLWA